MAEVHLYFRTHLVTDPDTAAALSEQAEALKTALVAAGAEANACSVAVLPSVADVVDAPVADMPVDNTPDVPTGDAGEGESDVR